MKIEMKRGAAIETELVDKFRFHSKQQEEKAKNENIVEAFDFRYTFSLPMYIDRQIVTEGFVPVLIGYTTYKSSTWGLKRAGAETHKEA